MYRTYLTERVRLDLGKFMLHVVGIHGADLIASGRAEDFDDLHELVDTGLAREQWLSKHELGHDTTSRPHICMLR